MSRQRSKGKGATQQLAPFADGGALDGYLATTGDLPEHYAAIGRFISAFNQIEMHLSLTIKLYLGVHPPLARALLGGMRVENLMETFRRVAEAKHESAEKVATMEAAFSEVNRLKAIRDVVGHRVFMFKDDKMAFHTAFTGRGPDTEVSIYTVSELNQHAAQAGRIMVQLMKLHFEPGLGETRTSNRDESS